MSTLTRQTFDRKSQPEYPFDIGYRWVKNGNDHVQVPLTEEDFLHPQEEDRFLFTENETVARYDLRSALIFVLGTRSDVHVFTNHRVDWQTHGIRPMGPDVVVFGDLQTKWNSLLGTVPVRELGLKTLFVAEITWRSSRHIDLEQKPPLYHQLGVPYLLIFDLYAGDEEPFVAELLAFEATESGFVRMEADPKLGVWIPTVAMWFKLDGRQVVMHNQDKKRILSQKEMIQLMILEERNSGNSITDADYHLKRFEAAEQRTIAARQQFEAARQRTIAERQRYETEKLRTEQLKREIAELRAQIANLPPKNNGHK